MIDSYQCLINKKQFVSRMVLTNIEKLIEQTAILSNQILFCVPIGPPCDWWQTHVVKWALNDVIRIRSVRFCFIGWKLKSLKLRVQRSNLLG